MRNESLNISNPQAVHHEDPICGKGYFILVLQAVTEFSSKKTTLLIVSAIKQKGCFPENFLLHFQVKARPQRQHNCQVSSGSCLQLLCYWPILRDLLSTARSWRPGCTSSLAQQRTAQAWACYVVHESIDAKQSSSEVHCNVSLGHKFYLHLMEESRDDLCFILPWIKFHLLRRMVFYSANRVSKSHYLIVCVKIQGVSSSPINQKAESSVLALPLGTAKRDSHPHSILRWLMYSK